MSELWERTQGAIVVAKRGPFVGMEGIVQGCGWGRLRVCFLIQGVPVFIWMLVADVEGDSIPNETADAAAEVATQAWNEERQDETPTR